VYVDEAHEELETINWQEFKNSFRSHHVPLGVMKLKKKEFEDLKHGSMTLSEYVTWFTQLSRYAPDNMDTNEKKQGWFLNELNDGLAYALEARDFINFQDMVDKALVLENRRGIMKRKRKMQHTGPQGSNMRIRIGSSSYGPNFCPGQQIGQPRMQAMGQGFQSPSDKFNAPTFRLLALHSRHPKKTVMHRILVLWGCATVVVRLGTMLIDVLGSRQIRLQLQAQIRTSTTMLTIVQPLQQGKIKLVLTWTMWQWKMLKQLQMLSLV
jgi:hypothetical protein